MILLTKNKKVAHHKLCHVLGMLSADTCSASRESYDYDILPNLTSRLDAAFGHPTVRQDVALSVELNIHKPDFSRCWKICCKI